MKILSLLFLVTLLSGCAVTAKFSAEAFCYKKCKYQKQCNDSCRAKYKPARRYL